MTETSQAAALAEARRTRTRSAPGLKPGLDEQSAYRLQDIAAAAYGSRRIGYKIGATSPQAQKIIGCDAPFFGPMFESDRIAPGAALRVDDTMLGLECEFAFQMARAYPLEGDARSIEGLADAVGHCVPAFEIVGSRIAGEGFPPALSCIADFGLNSWFCPGPAIADWRDLNLADIVVTASSDGVETNRGAGSAVYGHPLAALLWLAETLARQGRRLEAGDWVSTGTCLGVVAIKPGSLVTSHFSNGSDLSLKFT